MPDLDVVAVLKAKPGSEDVVRDALSALVEPTRAEDGCIGYELFVSHVEPATFLTVEKWRSQADLDAHLGSAHVQQAVAVAGDHFDGPPAVHSLNAVG